MDSYALWLHDLLKIRFPVVQLAGAESPPCPAPRRCPHRRSNQRRGRGGAGFLVDCPFCGDNCQSLYIDGRYGSFDSAQGCNNLDLAVCLAYDCVKDPTVQEELGRWVFEGGGVYSGVVFLEPGELPPDAGPLPEVSAPGYVVPLQHPQAAVANAYLRGRGFDPAELTAVWGVGCCLASRYPAMRGRVSIPIYQGGTLVGWQGRLVVGLDPRAEEQPKYVTMRGLRKSRLLYNQDTAREHPVVVICEGCADVWGVGPAGVALLGKQPSREQLRLLVTLWAGRTTVVLLDPDAEAEARELAERLRPFFPGRLVLAVLPEGLDPGACPRRPLWGFLRAKAADQGVELPWSEELLGSAR